MHNRTGPKRGMTLAEVMVAVGIIVILVAVFVPIARTVVDTNRAQAALGTIATIETALASYTQYWKPLIANGRGWPVQVVVSGSQPPLSVRVPGLPPLRFGVESSVVWDSYGNQTALVVPHQGGQWVKGSVQSVDNVTPIFEANQCLAWALTADIGGGPFLGDLDASFRKQGAYIDPLTEDKAVGVGEAEYPRLPDWAPRIPSIVKENLVDPWGRPYLYGWEIQIDRSNPGETTARFVKAWVASSGPDRSIDPQGQLWVRDAKSGGANAASENLDNIVP